jgi:hypothetical protein
LKFSGGDDVDVVLWAVTMRGYVGFYLQAHTALQSRKTYSNGTGNFLLRTTSSSINLNRILKMQIENSGVETYIQATPYYIYT